MPKFYVVVALDVTADENGNLNPKRVYGPASFDTCARFVAEAEAKGPLSAAYAILSTAANELELYICNTLINWGTSGGSFADVI